MVGALRTRAAFTGIEQRPALVQTASTAAQWLGVADRMRFVNARATSGDLLGFRALYLHNPFGENLHPPPLRLDHTVELGGSRSRQDVALMVRFAARVDRA